MRALESLSASFEAPGVAKFSVYRQRSYGLENKEGDKIFIRSRDIIIYNAHAGRLLRNMSVFRDIHVCQSLSPRGRCI
ncbi:hypothetical protein PM082_021353 [Marasmius tenuissimus]|nr:hypothetical protein PM082_021353 [Marasmius tenuissimus]